MSKKTKFEVWTGKHNKIHEAIYEPIPAYTSQDPSFSYDGLAIRATRQDGEIFTFELHFGDPTLKLRVWRDETFVGEIDLRSELILKDLKNL